MVDPACHNWLAVNQAAATLVSALMPSLTLKKPSTFKKPCLVLEIVSQKIPVQNITQSLTCIQTATIAKLECVAAVPSVKLAGEGQTDLKVCKFILKSVLLPSNYHGPHSNITASDTNQSR